MRKEFARGVLPSMRKEKASLIAIGVLVGLDLIALLSRAAILDFYLRPLVLVAILVHGLLLDGPSVRARRLILAGLAAATVTEFLQRFTFQGQWPLVAGATALYYLLYSLGFASRRGAAWSVRSAAPFAAVGVYMLVMFLWLQPYGLIREPAFLYMAVTTVMVGLGLRPYAVGNRDTGARFGAAGVLLLLISDTIRVITLLKLGEQSGTYFFDYMMEAVILTPFFAGHFFVVRSLR